MTASKVVKIKINDQEVEVPSDQNLIQAAALAGVEIPHYCYHPHLSAPAVCRMCLVEVEGLQKLQPACNTALRDGLRIKTNTPAVQEAVREVLAFTLINHPLDCPVCDQAGECGLHDYYQDYGLYNSQFQLPKVHKPKVVPIGPTLTLDAERCILCTRCVRFSDEITHTHEMAIVHRGEHSEIQAIKEVNHPYSVNLADICPVGALTETQFRFKVRRWFLQSQESICPGCARGCNTVLDHYRGQVHRMRPRENPTVNAAWMCDDGRALISRLQQGRLLQPMVRKMGRLEPVSWTEAWAAAVQLLQEAKGAVAAQSSAHVSNETAFVLAELLKHLGAPAAAPPLPGPPGWKDDDLLRRGDRTPNRAGTSLFVGNQSFQNLLSQARVALVVQEHVGNLDHNRLFGSIYLGSHLNPTAQLANIILPFADWAEYDGTFTNFQGRVQRFRRTVPAPAQIQAPWEVLQTLWKTLGGTGYSSVAALFDVMATQTEAFRGMTFATLKHHGLWWHGKPEETPIVRNPDLLSDETQSRPWRML